MHQKHLWKEHVYSALLYSLSSILTNSGPKLLRCLTFYLCSIGNQGAEHHCRAEPGLVHQVQGHPEESPRGWLAMDLQAPGTVCPSCGHGDVL